MTKRISYWIRMTGGPTINVMRKIRRAETRDAEGIHTAHMRSIQEVCAKDHSPEEIAVWGFRPFQEDSLVNAITSQYVWVVESDGLIEGYGHLVLEETDDQRRIAHIYGLYLAPEAIRCGMGSEILRAIIKEARALGATQILLESTITAHGFYKKMGFADSGPQTKISISGVDIRCFPMVMSLLD